MELSRTIPAGAVRADQLADLMAVSGPVLTARLALSPAQTDAEHRGRLAWEALAGTARDHGATDSAIDAAAEVVAQLATTEPGLVIVAGDDGIVTVEVTQPTWTADVVRWQPLPWFEPVVSARQSSIDHAVVRVDRRGAEVQLIEAEEVQREIEVRGRTVHLRKVGAGGWSQRRYQERAEQGWRANAEQVTERVVRLLTSGATDLVLVGGEQRSEALVDERIPDELAERIVAVDVTRAADGAEELELEAIRRALADVVARQTVGLLRELREAGGQQRAVTDPSAVMTSLARGQVAVLLVSDGDDAAPHTGPLEGEAAGFAEQLEAGTGLEVGAVPFVDAASWAAVSSGAGIRSVPAHAVDGPVAALLRWTDG